MEMPVTLSWWYKGGAIPASAASRRWPEPDIEVFGTGASSFNTYGRPLAMILYTDDVERPSVSGDIPVTAWPCRACCKASSTAAMRSDKKKKKKDMVQMIYIM